MKHKKIIRDLCLSHGIKLSQGEEIASSLFKQIAEIMSVPRKDEEGLFDPDAFPVIHIDSFGKFIPNKKNIRFINSCINKKK
jgi:hypothetical protein